MSVVFDPHGTVAENVQTKEAQTLPATGPRLFFPKEGPFYSDLEFAVFDGTTELKEQVHYYKVLPYATGVLRTARRVHGAILIINDNVSRSLTVTYHPVGINAATAAEQSTFIATNPTITESYWEDVVGDPYFPPVDIQFDWDNWCGEQELMNAFGVLAEGLKYKPPKKDPLLETSAPGYKDDYQQKAVSFDTLTGRHRFGSNIPFRFDLGNYNNSQLGDYKYKVEYFLPNMETGTEGEFSILFNNNWGGTFFSMRLVYDAVTNAFVVRLTRYKSSQDQNAWDVVSFPFARALFKKPFTVEIKRHYNQNGFELYLTNDDGTVGKLIYNHGNPPANLLNVYTTYGIASALSGKTDIRSTAANKYNGYMRIWDIPGFEADISEDMFGLLRLYYNLLRSSFDQAPAHDHIVRTDNPHNEEAGWIKALVRNGISADATRVFSRTLPQLTTYINNLAPTQASLVNKVRREVASRTLKGTIVGVEGLTTFTQGSAAADIRILSKFDKLQSWLIARNDNVSITAAQYIDIKAGTGVLRLYSDARGLQWNGAKLLTHDTIGPYIPQGGAAADGFVGVSTATVTLTGKGIGSNPFVATWVAPSAADLNTLAMRMTTDEFGTSQTLAATPALIAKLATNFTGKLLKTKANVNGLFLGGSISLSKSLYGLSEVVDISDILMPMSDAMEQLIADYEDNPNHTHPASMFGITQATITVKGTVKLAELVNDTTVALDGRGVLEQNARLDEVDTNSQDTLSPEVINILRYGGSGTGLVEGVEVEDYMLSIPQNSYYCGGARTAPAVSYNLIDLFPGAYIHKTFYVYVDAKADGTAVYSISPILIQENDTLTQIGTVLTDGEAIYQANINNVTRLGNFREFEEHTSNPNAHIEKTADKDSLGLSSVRDMGAAQSNYKTGFTNGQLDWTGVYGNAAWTQGGKNLMYLGWSANAKLAIGFMHRQKQSDYTYAASIVADTSQDNGGWAGLLMAYRKVGTEEHTLSIIANPDVGGFSNSNGEPVTHGIVIDAGQATEIVIPAITGRGNTRKLSSLLYADWNIARVGNVFTVQLPAVSATETTTDKFVVDFDALTVVASNSVGESKQTNIGPLMRTKGIDTDFFKGGVNVGVLGLYKSKVTNIVNTHPIVNNTALYSTLGSLIDNVSPLGKVRVAKGTLSAANLTQAQIETQVGTPVLPTLDGRGIKYSAVNCSYYSLNTAFTMLMVRTTK